MSISVPAPKIDIYKSGFDGVCKLGRAEEGKKLSELVEKVSEPLVIAVDAPWGAGKSFFLKCWVGAHQKENSGIATTVYFDAFRHDFLDDPLIGLTSVIAERLTVDGIEDSTWQKAKEAAAKLVRPAFRTGLTILTSGASELTGPIVDAALEAGSKELSEASKQFWKKEDGKRAAMSGFRSSLEELSSNRKLVIVVDELDRCRPDYALSMLEVIKHFFDVPNVHFVLGVNLRELENSVRARYGNQISAEKYVQKFISVAMPLIPPQARNASQQIQIRHFEDAAKLVGLHKTWKYEPILDYLKLVDYHQQLSLRDVEKITTLAMVTPDPSQYSESKMHLHIGIIVLNIIAPKLIYQARKLNLNINDITSVFRLSKEASSSFLQDAYYVWTLATWDRNHMKTDGLMSAEERLFEKEPPKEALRNMITASLDVFKLKQ